MDYTLSRASELQKDVMANLMQYYIYDFSPYVHYEVGADGLYSPYPDLDTYWSDEDKFPYFITKDHHYVGFVLIKQIVGPQARFWSMAEFFVLKKYRGQGVGKAMAFEVFNLHRGLWEVHQMESNLPAQLFWINVINAFTSGLYAEQHKEGNRIQTFES